MSCNDNSTDSKSPSECTKSECIDNQDGNVFKCRKCGRNVHFECSQLPAYQIQTFLKYKTIRSNYICQNCIQPEVWVKDLIKNSVTSDAAQTETNKKNIDDAPNSVASQTANSKDFDDLQKKVREQEKLIKQYKEKEGLLQKELEEKVAINKTLKEQLQNNPGYHTLEFVEEKMEMKLDSFKETILTAIKESANNTETKISDVTSYASVAKETPKSLRVIIKEARSEEYKEDLDKKARRNNVIIYGVADKDFSDKEEEDKSNGGFAENMFKDLGVSISKKRIERIGTFQKEKSRPLKLSFTSEEDKKSIMANLKNLKGIDKYRKMSVIDDYTRAERILIKKWADKAKKLNAEQNDVIWRVRGSPETRLYLKKFNIQIQASQQ